MQLIVLKYMPILITDDEDIEIIFLTISSHQCLFGTELYLDMQSIEDTGFAPNRMVIK